jgi:hypothetical protein
MNVKKQRAKQAHGWYSIAMEGTAAPTKHKQTNKQINKQTNTQTNKQTNQQTNY